VRRAAPKFGGQRAHQSHWNLVPVVEKLSPDLSAVINVRRGGSGASAATTPPSPAGTQNLMVLDLQGGTIQLP
jgi:hypothetical protein